MRFWSGVGLAALAIALACALAGMGALYPNEVASKGTVELLPRLSLTAATVVWAALCTVAGSLAVGAVALVRGRPAGAPVDIACRAFACVAVANLVHLVPIAHPTVKLLFDGVSFVVAAGFLARAAFRMRSLDAFAAASVATGAVAALAAAAYAVVWAVSPR